MASKAQDQVQKSLANQTSDSYSAQPVLLRLSQDYQSQIKLQPYDCLAADGY